MNNKYFAMLIAAVAFIGFATIGSLHRNNQSVTQPEQYTLVVWRRES